MITVFCPDCQTHAVEIEWYEASDEIMVSCANCGERLGTIKGNYTDFGEHPKPGMYDPGGADPPMYKKKEN
jgi:hypothetical protein